MISRKFQFQKIPIPFGKLTELGSQLRQIHLLESPVVEQLITTFPVEGDHVVREIYFIPYDYEVTLPNEDGTFTYPDYLGTASINKTQYFADVPSSAWNLYIGSYQPARKWLRNRKGRTLGFEDIIHYQKIIVALAETARLMKLVDAVGKESSKQDFPQIIT